MSRTEDLFTYKVIKRKEKIGTAKCVGKISEWYKKPQAGVAKVNDTSLKIESSLFLVNENIAWCQPAIIQSIQIDKISIDETGYVEEELEIGLKFDVDAKQGLALYVLVD